jgi:hypothetical protein
VAGQSHFRPELLPPPSMFWKRELERLSRPSRGWARSKCPLHGGSNPTAFSVNLETGAFYCFRCLAKGGDLVDYLQLRYRLTFKAAAMELGAWDETNTVTSAEVRRLQNERKRKREAEAAKKEQERRERLEVRSRLHSMERLYGKTNFRLAQLQRGAQPRFKNEIELAWWFLSDLLPRIREDDSTYRALAGIGGEL